MQASRAPQMRTEGVEDLHLCAIFRVGPARPVDADAQSDAATAIQRDPGRGTPISVGDTAKELVVIARPDKTLLRHVMMQQMDLVRGQAHQDLRADILARILLLIDLGVEFLVAGRADDLRSSAAAHLE